MAVNGIIGIKLGMTQVFAEDGSLVGCTVLQAGPCVVVQRRTKDKDGYEAAQLGLVEFVKPQRVKGHDGALQKGQRRADESSARSALAGIEGRNQSWRPRLGGKLQGRRTGGRKRRQQGKRFSGRREALALRGRRCDARFDVSP